MAKGKDRLSPCFFQNKSRKVEKRKHSNVRIEQSRKARGDRQVSFFLPADLIRAFQIRAIEEDKTKSELAEACIRKYLAT